MTRLVEIDPAGLSDDALVDHVARLARERRLHEDDAEELRQAVVDAFKAGRSRTPPVLQKRLADAAGITEGGVIAALKKHEKRRLAAAG